MKKYTPEYKSKITNYYSFNFAIETEDNVSLKKEDVTLYLKKLIIENDDDELYEGIELWDTVTEEYENEPDWDMLPGGKDYD